MPYQFLEDVAIADIAFQASARSLKGMFIAAADATMNVMVEPLNTIEAVQRQEFLVEAEAVDMLLFNFLQEIIFYKDARRLLLRALDVVVRRRKSEWKLKAKMYGEELNPDKHTLRVDVKAVTLHRFRVEKKGNVWEAFVILDI